ncbi:MAG: hemolysin D [Gammaproteobacteria bacterium]|nr:MAG: hemolysin D [Gammaproteobacteria bacterium]
MSKKIIIFSILTLAVVVGGYHYQQQQKQNHDESMITLYGNVDIREAQLAFNSSEHVQKLLVQEGDHVKKGQLLATLHTEILDAQLLQAQAQLLTSQQTLSKLEAGNRKEEINKAQAEFNAANARKKAAIDSYERLKPLLRKKLISPDDLEKSQSLADSAKAETEAVRQMFILLKAGPRKEDIAIAKAVLASSEATVQLAKQKLNDANLYAPADGVIRNRILEPGDMAFPQTPVMTLAFIDPVWVRAYLPEPALGKIKPGSAATIHTDSFPDKIYQGWVGYISPTAEFTPKVVQTEELRTRLVYSVKIFACNPQDELRLGMPVTVQIDTAKPTAVQHDTTSVCKQ